MSFAKKALIVLAMLAILAPVVYRLIRGPRGASTELGGTLEARSIPEFQTLDPGRWANGAPVSLASTRGEVVFIEGWGPA
jgi:hypothetical protein